jgi:DNA-directed RNA polymerase subunit M/transcription elongation factor TFIIS
MNRPDLDKAIEAALVALEEHGVARELAVVGVTHPTSMKTKKGVGYETHVGRQVDKQDASLLGLVADDLRAEAKQQAMVLFDEENCPSCGSPRYGPQRQAVGGHRTRFFQQCMDCGHEAPPQ